MRGNINNYNEYNYRIVFIFLNQRRIFQRTPPHTSTHVLRVSAFRIEINM